MKYSFFIRKKLEKNSSLDIFFVFSVSKRYILQYIFFVLFVVFAINTIFAASYFYRRFMRQAIFKMDSYDY